MQLDVKKLAQELRDVADALDTLEFPEDSQGWAYGTDINLWNLSKKDLQVFARAMHGVDKNATEHSFSLSKKFGDIRVSAYAKDREAVCTKKVLEVVKVPKKAYVEIPGEFTEREIVEWECDPILGG